MYVSMYVCMYACMYVCMHVCVCMYVCVCVRVYVCMYILCTYVCTYVCMYVCMCLCVCIYVYICIYIYVYISSGSKREGRIYEIFPATRSKSRTKTRSLLPSHQTPAVFMTRKYEIAWMVLMPSRWWHWSLAVVCVSIIKQTVVYSEVWT